MATAPAFDLKGYKPEGDKKNSVFFNEFLPQVYERRVSSGLDDMLTTMAAVMSAFTDPAGPAPVLTADGIQRRVGKDGRYARAKGMVEERAIHAKAESRIEQILGL